MVFYFDVHGTLDNNRHLQPQEAKEALKKLKDAGHTVVVWSGDSGAAKHWEPFATTIISKGLHVPPRGAVIVDDDRTLLKAFERYNHVVVHASEILTYLAKNNLL